MNLRELRISRRLQQQEVAEKIGITKQAYSHYETGRREADYNTLIKLANYFDVTIDYLLGRSEQTSPAENEKKAPSLTEQEQSLIDMFRSCDISQRGQIIGYTKAVCDDNRRKYGATSLDTEKKQA